MYGQIVSSREYKFIQSAASTNAALRDAVVSAGRPLFSVICADRQTAGVGRQGRSFFSPAGGIYFSADFPLTGKEAHLPFFSLLAGLQVCKTLEDLTGAPLRIKWPNDLWLNGKKVCGVLAQTVTAANAPVVILGVGINAAPDAEKIPPELKGIMTSFTAEGYPAPPKEETVKKIVAALDAALYQQRALCGDLSDLIAEIESRNALTGRRVQRVLPGKTVSGTVCGLSEEGGLLLRSDSGKIEELTCGEVIME